ncbi:glycerol-3-phosphate responsive antiterminator [Propionimicrobium lymphophilum]|uniref:glycerol-3-phosphate responsive antiterminator n=1 Tax=Propionimicrobium lymphophilum TaxID=33012 RepID=UPI0023F4F08E|nr:glycerol-3-phosphate responsive antiterminator [Propionimicrobium lymphophilum]
MIELPQGSVIPSVRRLADLDHAVEASCPYVLLTNVHVGNLAGLAKRVIEAEKRPMVHVDLIGGFRPDRDGIRLLKNMYKIAGIFTQSSQVVDIAKKASLKAIQRVFMLDSRFFENGMRSVHDSKPDGVEFLPGLVAGQNWAKIRHLKKSMTLIAGGMIETRKDATDLLSVGFNAITTSDVDLWNYEEAK